MPKRRELTRVGADYPTIAPVTGRVRQSVPASAAETFRCLEDPEAWGEWIREIESVTWTTPEPFGVGTTRTVVTRFGTIDEEFHTWEPGSRMAFWFTATTDPLFGAFAEDYLIEPRSDNRCELTWRYGFELRPRLRLLQPLVAAAFGRAARASARRFAIYMAEHRDRYR